jgi:L-2-hydroxycarboxylate dehydrogenase (NAD+)
VDRDGNPTQDPEKVHALLPFGRHKGYGLSLINELVGAFIGGSLPTLRSRPEDVPAGIDDEKTTPAFFFQVIHPDAVSGGAFARGRDQAGNVRAVLEDVLGHGNAPPDGSTILPGQLEHEAALASEAAGGLLFTDAEVREFKQIADECGFDFDPATLAAAGS